MQAQTDYGIEDQFVNLKNYTIVAEQSKRRNILYDDYLEVLQKIFAVYKNFYDQTHQLFKVKIHQKSVYVQQLKSFLRKFGQIIRDTSLYQIDTITQIRVTRQDTINRVTSQLFPKIQGYQKTQTAFKSKLKQINQRKQQIIKNYSNLKSQISQASAFYNKQTKIKVKSIVQKIDNTTQQQKQLQLKKKQIMNNAQQFQQYLINFRKRLLQNKYTLLNKMIDQSKHFRNCLTEVLLLLIECVNSKMETFMCLVKNPKDDTITISQSKGRKKGEDIDTVVGSLINSIQEYYHIIDEVVFILKGLDAALKRVHNRTEEILQISKKTILDNLNNIYDIQETPLRQVNDTLDLYQYYSNKISSISDKMYQCSNKLTMLKQNVKKHADVTLSLIRSTPHKTKEQTKIPQVDQVYNQISYDFVTEILCQVYRSFKQALSDLKTHFNQKYYKKKKNKIQDSMQISHIDQTMIAKKKKPNRSELWLWRDWRDKTNFTNQQFDYNPKQINQFLQNIKFVEESKELGKYQCIFYGKKDVKGILKICEKALEFVSIVGGGNVHLCIPYEQIASVETKVRIFQKYIAIQTQKGEIGFSKLLDIVSVQNQIKQKAEKASNGAVKVVKKQAVQLLPQQLDFIQKNKQRLYDQRPSIEGMMKIKTCLIDNITIDQVYQYIYSDKTFTLRGKPEESFFAYAQKKEKNFNYVAGNYDKPGPEFYSRAPGVKFNNCPQFSTRINQYDHPIPPIPFMPKFCHCKQTCTVHWLSNEAFDYHILSQSSKAPYAEYFVVKILHRVYKQGNGVKIQMYGGLFFNTDFAMKGMVKSKGQAQMLQKGANTLQQIQKSLNIVTGNCSQAQKQGKQQTTQGGKPKQEGTETSSNQVNKLKNQNKLLIIALVVVFIVNILLRFVLS